MDKPINAFELMGKLYDTYKGERKIKLMIVEDDNICVDEIDSHELSMRMIKVLKGYSIFNYTYCVNPKEIICFAWLTKADII